MSAAGENFALSVGAPVISKPHDVRDNLALLLSEVEPHFPSYAVLVVSDGSTDGANQILREWSPPHARSNIFERNRGKGFVVREGFRTASGSYILFIDGFDIACDVWKLHGRIRVLKRRLALPHGSTPNRLTT